MNLIPARELELGARVRTKDGFGVVETVEYDRARMITGGDLVKASHALKITLKGGAKYHVHPDSEIFSDQ
jgi:hypothetical protein